MLECYSHSPAPFYIFNGLIVLGLAIYLSRYGARSSSITWLRTFFIFSATYNISHGLIRCSQNSQTFEQLLVPFTLANALMIPILLVFTFHFINRRQILERLWMRLFLFALGIGTLYIFWNTDLFLVHDFTKATFELNNHVIAAGTQSQLFGFLLLIGYLTPTVIMARYLRRVEDPKKRTEIRIVIAALTILVVPGTILEGMIPLVFHVPGVPSSPFTTVITAIMITYAITKYGLHVFNLDNVSGNVMQIMPGGLVILDHTNTIQYANTGATTMLGYKPGQLAGASAKKLFRNAVDYGHFQTDVLAHLGPGHSLTGQEATFATRSNQPVAVSLNAVDVYTGQELVNRLISFTDITRLKQAEAAIEAEKTSVERQVVQRTRELREAQAQLTASVRSLPFGFAVINHQGEIVFSNSLLGKLFNHAIPTEPAASKAALEQIAHDFAAAIDLMDCIHQSQTKSRSLERNITFGPRFFRFFFMPVMADTQTNAKTKTKTKTKTTLGTVLIVEDVTEAKSLERSRDEFFSIASHELRTPLTAIRGNAGLMLQYYAGQLKDPEMHAMVDDIYAASLRLIAIVNDFLDMSRLEMGKFVFENHPFNIAELIRQILREYDVTGSRKKLGLNLDHFDGPDPWANADADRARQVMVNLIGNAIKSTDHGSITVNLKRQGNLLQVRVTDTGIGIPEASQHLLFRKFQQASNNILTRDNTQSTGLGLYISRLLAAGMHGRLFLEKSVVGQGSTFVLEVPAASPSAPSASATASASPTPTPRRK